MMKTITILFALIYCTLVSYSQADSNAKGDLFKKAILQRGKTFVIIIGVSEYENLENEKQLDFADDDAELFSSYISTWDNTIVKKYIDKEAASKDLLGFEIENTLTKEAAPGDMVIIFFSGHGDVDPSYGDGYLLLNTVQPPNNHSYRWNSALSIGYIKDMINSAANKGVEVLLFIDACRSGLVQNSNDDANQRIKEIGNNAANIVSCGPNETSIESSKYGKGHGVFTYYLVQGLSGLADIEGDNNGVISFKEIGRYVQDKVAFSEPNQNPIFNGSPTKKIAIVDDKLLQLAQKEENVFLNYSTLATTKSVRPEFSNLSSSTYAMMELLKGLVSKGLFFADEVVSNNDNKLKVNESTILQPFKDKMYDIAVTRSGDKVVAAGNNGIAIYNDGSKTVSKWLKGHRGGVTSVEIHPNDNILASGSWDNSVILWDLSTGEKLKTLGKLSGDIFAIKFVTASVLAIGTNAGDIYIWDFEAETSNKYSFHKKKINDISVNYPFIFSSSDDGYISIFNFETEQKVKKIKAHSSRATGLCVLPISNQLLSVGYDGKLKRWDLNSFELISELKLSYKETNAIAVDPFENYCFVGSKRYGMDVIDLMSNSTYTRLISTKRGIPCVTFNSTSSSVEIGGYGGQLIRQNIDYQPSGVSALEIYEKLVNNNETQSIKYKIDGTVIIGLNNYVTNVLDALVNGDAVKPSIENIQKALRYAKKALEIGKGYIVDNHKLEINVALLEIFIVIENKDMSGYSSAIEEIKMIEKLDPKGAYVYNTSGILLAEMNKLSEAKTKANKAENLAPLWAEATCNVGKILVKEKKYTEAEEKFIETIEKGPNLSKGYVNLGKLYTFLGQFDKAKTNTERALKIDPGVDEIISSNIENSFYTGDIPNVKRLINRVTYMNSAMYIAKSDLEFLEKGRNTNYDLLVSNYEQAIALDSNNIDAWNGLGYFYLRIMDFDAAEKFISKKFSSSGNDIKIKPKTLLKRECKEIFNKARQIDKNNLIAEIGLWKSRSVVKSSTIDAFIKKHNESAEAYFYVGKYLLDQDDAKSASSYFKKAISANDQYYKSYLFAMECNKEIGKSKKNAALIKKMKNSIPQGKIMKYKNEIMAYIELY